jgi:sortase A
MPPTLPATSPAVPVPRPALPRGLLRSLSGVLMVSGALLLADVAATLAWQEPLSALYATVRQDQLSADLRALERVAPSPLAVTALARLPQEGQRIAFLARDLERRQPEGAAVGRIEIPRLGRRFVLIKGTASADLRDGPGIYPQTRFPGVPGTTAIAGHRTTYSAPFRHIDGLRHGDEIVIAMPYARFTYQVSATRIVAPTDVGVIDPTSYSRLVLSACHPLYSARQRIVVVARLVHTEPLGTARNT